MATARIHSKESTKEIPLSPVVSVLNTLIKEGVAVRHDCGGKALCGTCRVRVHGGAEGAGLNPIDGAERKRLDAVGAEPDERLACRLYSRRDVELTVPGREG